jgi:hypothetical protein
MSRHPVVMHLVLFLMIYLNERPNRDLQCIYGTMIRSLAATSKNLAILNL